MSDDKKDNLIIFPIQKGLQDQKNLKKSDEKIDDTVIHLSSVEQEPEKSGPDSAGKNSKKNFYITASVTSALCLMLVGFPFVSNLSNEERGLACVSDDLECIQREQKEKERLKREQEKILSFEREALSLIKTGQRGLASIGRKPDIKDIFLIERLKSNYQVRWNRDRLVYAVLLEDRTPVFLPPVDQLVREYNSLFPKHVSIKRLDALSGDMEIYELKDAEGLNVAQVEALKDRAGRVISIHVQ